MNTKAPELQHPNLAYRPLLVAEYIPYLIPMIGTPPYRFEGMTNFSLFLEADQPMMSAERDIVDKYLNEPLGCSGKNCVFRAANLHPFLVFSNVVRSCSTSGDAGQAIAYQEVSLIIPVVIQDLPVVGWFLPILFVDGPPDGGTALQGAVPIVIGREMYGLPKVPARIEFDFQGRRFNSGSVTLLGQDEPIITVRGELDHSADQPVEFTGEQRLKFAERVFGPIKPNHDYTRGTTQSGHFVDLLHIGHGNPLIGMRQMRNASKLDESGHQDVVQSPYQMDQQTMPSPLGNKLTIEFALASGLFSGLHLQEKYVLQYPTDGAVYSNVAALFGEPKETVIRHGKSDFGAANSQR